MGAEDWVERLVAAENEGGQSGREKADRILAQDFIAITRASGKVEDREALLDTIEKHENKNYRKFHRVRDGVRVHGDAAVVTSVVTTHNPVDTGGEKEVLGTYRNIHVFHGMVDEVGQCVAWQVTEQKPASA